MATLIELDRVSKIYPMPGGDVHALRSVSLSIERGEFVSIVGASGSGKTTMLYLIGLLTSPSEGTYRLNDRAVDKLSDRELSAIRGREIGFVFQSFHLVPQLSVLGNIELAARYAGNGSNGVDLRRRARDLIDHVGLAHRADHRPGELSGGEMQRVAIARALLTKPPLILADEPTGNLDEATGEQIFGILESLTQEGCTVILVTHERALAARTSRQIRLRDGEIVDESA